MDFASLTEAFFADAVVREAKYGRFQAIGRDIDGVISVVFAALGIEGLSIISMRKATAKERTLFNAQSKSEARR